MIVPFRSHDHHSHLLTQPLSFTHSTALIHTLNRFASHLSTPSHIVFAPPLPHPHYAVPFNGWEHVKGETGLSFVQGGGTA